MPVTSARVPWQIRSSPKSLRGESESFVVEPQPHKPPRNRLVRGVVLVAVLVIGAELLLFLRTVRSPAGDATSGSDATGAVTVAPPAAPVAEEAPTAGGLRASAAAVRDAAPLVVRAADEAGPATAATPIAVALRRHDLLVAAHNQQAIQEADERAFAQSNLPEHQRVAIRLLNEREARQRQERVAAERDDLTPEEQAGISIAIGDAIARERQAALKDLLGADSYAAFQVAESAELRRIQRRYRAQWAQELDEQAPLPPGLPPRAH